MSLKYDNKCRQCDDGVIIKDKQEETCDVCDGYGYLLTFEGLALIEFLKRRGFSATSFTVKYDFPRRRFDQRCEQVLGSVAGNQCFYFGNFRWTRKKPARVPEPEMEQYRFLRNGR